MNFERQLKKLIVNVATGDITIDSINDETILTNDLGYDSVQLIELIVQLEEVFDIEIEDEDLEIENLTVFRNLLDTIERRAKG